MSLIRIASVLPTAIAILLLPGALHAVGDDGLPSSKLRLVPFGGQVPSDDPWAAKSDPGYVQYPVAYLSRTNAVVGEPVLLVISFRNLHDVSIGFRPAFTDAVFSVWMRDQAGKPMPPKGPGWQNKDGREYDDRDDFFVSDVKPGFAMGIKVPLEKCFDLSKPGKYIVVAAYETGSLPAYTEQLSFVLTGSALKAKERDSGVGKAKGTEGSFSRRTVLTGSGEARLGLAGSLVAALLWRQLLPRARGHRSIWRCRSSISAPWPLRPAAGNGRGKKATCPRTGSRQPSD